MTRPHFLLIPPRILLCCFLLLLFVDIKCSRAFLIPSPIPATAKIGRNNQRLTENARGSCTATRPTFDNPTTASTTTTTTTTTTLYLARTTGKNAKTVQQYQQQTSLPPKWFPRKSSPTKKVVYDDDIFGTASDYDEKNDDDDNNDDDIEKKGVELSTKLIQSRLDRDANNSQSPSQVLEEEASLITDGAAAALRKRNAQLAQGRFIDLACTEQGERVLEQLFTMEPATTERDERVVQAAIMALQSICILGTQVGVKGSPQQLQRMIAHLDSRGDQEAFRLRDLDTWDTDSVRRLKYRLDRMPALQVLAELKWRQTTQGASDLLIALGAWGKHEDLPLLRSGFSIRFREEEMQAAEEASKIERDPDANLGLRKDFRHMKVFTIDSAETSEIDDGISLEKYAGINGVEKKRIWIHIADAERWAPRDSKLFDIARRRVTSLYLPNGAIPMLPPKASDDIMSLTMNKDSFALSLGVELKEDGSIDESSIVVTPSLIRVSYRLTYDEVDEMLEEGSGYSEEWELGALLSYANKRRQYRCSRGSSEGFVPTPIPQKQIKIKLDNIAPDGIRIDISVQATHNSGTNQTSGAEIGDAFQKFTEEVVEPVSSAFTLVTETMILAGEAIGKWKLLEDEANKGIEGSFQNEVSLPFRTQRKPDYTSRAREKNIMMSLMEYNIGGGYCHAWYCRRFLSPVKVQEECAPHSGLGLSCYVQWTSPIRRYSDLLTHVSVKRYLRRQRVQALLSKGHGLKELDVTAEDIGCPLPQRIGSDTHDHDWDLSDMDADIDFREGGGLMGAARLLQRNSEQYYLFEYIRRIHEHDPDKTWDAMVLGFIGSGDNSKKQYAIYIYELGLEYRMTSPVNLDQGTELKLKTSIISPRAGQLAFVRTL